MAYNGSDRRSPDKDRRSSSAGAPPPGTVIDRRLGLDPRKNADPRAKSAPKPKPTPAPTVPTDEGYSGLERKRGRGRRLSEFTKSAEEGEMTTEQFLFLMAIDAFKKGNDRMFPTWTDVLEVIRLLGYRKTMPTELNLPAAEDWLERSDAPANVRPERWSERFTETGSKAGGAGAARGGAVKTEQELTDEALEAFEAAFGSGDGPGNGFDIDSDFDEGFSEAA